MRLENLYKNADKSGISALIINYLELDSFKPLPLVFPHGIDYYQAKTLCDLHCHDPLYVATRQDIYENAIRVREAIKFPHPWLFLIDGYAPCLGIGTLFVASDPGLDTNEQLYKGIQKHDFAKPWGILLKDRGLLKEDFEWWQDRGFQTYCVGNHTNINFFQDLENVLTSYSQIATAHFTSVAFFAASLRMRVRIIEDVCLTYIAPLEYGQNSSANHIEDMGGKIRTIWLMLTSSDLEVSRKVALEHLGVNFMGTREELKARYIHAVENIKRPLHLYPIENAYVYNFILKIITFGIPIYKFYPFPINKVITRLRLFFGFHFCLKIKFSDFHDFGIVTKKSYYQEEYYWFWNPLVKRESVGNRFVPRWSFSKIRRLAAFLKVN